MDCKLRALTAASLTLLFAAAANAAVVFDENFEDVGDGNAITTANTDFTSIFQTASQVYTGRQDTGNLFLNGTDNIYAEIDDNGTGDGGLRYIGPVGQFTSSYTFRFEFYEPTSAGDDGALNFRLGVDDQSSGSTQNETGPQFALDDGEISGSSGGTDATGAYLLDTPYIIDVVVTNGGAITYTGEDGTPETLADDRYDVFFTNQLTGVTTQEIDDAIFRISAAGTPATTQDHNGFTVQQFSGNGVQLTFLDNIQVIDEPSVIPEPASLALLGLGGLMLLPRRRRA